MRCLLLVSGLGVRFSGSGVRVWGLGFGVSVSVSVSGPFDAKFRVWVSV